MVSVLKSSNPLELTIAAYTVLYLLDQETVRYAEIARGRSENRVLKRRTVGACLRINLGGSVLYLMGANVEEQVTVLEKRRGDILMDISSAATRAIDESAGPETLTSLTCAERVAINYANAAGYLTGAEAIAITSRLEERPHNRYTLPCDLCENRLNVVAERSGKGDDFQILLATPRYHRESIVAFPLGALAELKKEFPTLSFQLSELQRVLE